MIIVLFYLCSDGNLLSAINTFHLIGPYLLFGRDSQSEDLKTEKLNKSCFSNKDQCMSYKRMIYITVNHPMSLWWSARKKKMELEMNIIGPYLNFSSAQLL